MATKVGGPAPPLRVAADSVPLAADLGFSFADPFAIAVVFVGVAVFAAIGALSHQHERAFSASLIYLGFGLVAAAGIHFWASAGSTRSRTPRSIEHAAELARDRRAVRDRAEARARADAARWRTSRGCCCVAMPLTIAAVALFGTLGAWGCRSARRSCSARCLAPTDPVLAGDIGVGPPGDEDEREPNFSITGEAGLNDGLAFPFVLLGLSWSPRRAAGSATGLLADVLYAIVAGLAIGASLGYGIAALAVRLRDREPARTRARRLGGDRRRAGHLRRDRDRGRLRVPRRLRGRDRASAATSTTTSATARVHDGAEIVEKFGELALILLLGSMRHLDRPRRARA